MLHESRFQPIRHPSWGRRIFNAKTVQRGGVLRRSVRDVEREIGREALVAEVKARGFHLIECGGQFIIICNPGHMRVIC
jgi:hypothetical protein